MNRERFSVHARSDKNLKPSIGELASIRSAVDGRLDGHATWGRDDEWETHAPVALTAGTVVLDVVGLQSTDGTRGCPGGQNVVAVATAYRIWLRWCPRCRVKHTGVATLVIAFDSGTPWPVLWGLLATCFVAAV